MPRSSRHKPDKKSKHSTKEQSDAEDDMRKLKEKSSKDESSIRTLRDSGSGEKRKHSSHGEVLEEHVPSKRRKDKVDDFVDGDRWNGGGDVKDTGDRVSEKELDKRDIVKVDEKYKDKSLGGESSKLESKNRSKRNGSGVASDRKEEGSASLALEKEEKRKSDSRRKSEKDSSAHKAAKESKDKDRKSEKERNGVHESKSGDGEVKVMDWDQGKKQGINLGEPRHHKRPQDNTEESSQNLLHLPVREKEYEKIARRKSDRSSERDKRPDDFKEGDELLRSKRSDRSKDSKHRDEKYKDEGYAGKMEEDNHRSDRTKDEKRREEAEKDYKHYDDKFREDGDRNARQWDYRFREEGDKDIRPNEEKHHENSRSDVRRKDEKHREGQDHRRDDKFHGDADRNNAHKEDWYNEDGDKDIRSGDERYLDDGDRDDKRRVDGYRNSSGKENRRKDERYREDVEKDLRCKDIGGEIDREKRKRESKYDRDYRHRSGDRPDTKHSGDDGYSADYHAKKMSAYDESPTHDYRAIRSSDDQNKRRYNEKEEYGDSKSRSTKDQRSDAGKRSSKIDPASDRIRTTSRNADVDHSSRNRRRGSPSSSSHGLRDNYRSLKQDESKHRDNSHDRRPTDNHNSVRDPGSFEKSEKTASHLSEKVAQKDDIQPPEFPVVRHPKSDIHLSPLQRTGGSRDWREGRGSRELGFDAVPGEEHLQADNNAQSVSSPFARNGYSNSRSLPLPPQFRNGVDSPVGTAEDDVRNKFHNRNRRVGDPNMGRMQGNAWKGIPTWPSPMPNGFLPFPHAPPPVGFHPVMHPFPAPPMYGVRPPMELNVHSPYQMPDPDRYGPGRPLGWQNQVGDAGPPVHAWDGSNVVYGDESRMYGRPDWDQARNTGVWDHSDDTWKEPNRAKSLEMPSAGKEINSPRVGDEAGGTRNDQNFGDQPADSGVTSSSTKIFEKNHLQICVEDDDDFTKEGKKKASGLCQAYLCKLDISKDLAEPDLFARFSDLIDQAAASDVNDAKILYLEDVEFKSSSMCPLSSLVVQTIDNSVFQRSMSLYRTKKLTAPLPKDSSELEVKADSKSDMGTKTDTQGSQDGFPYSNSMTDPINSSVKTETTDETVAGVSLKTEEADVMVEAPSEENDVENQPLSAGENKEGKSVGTNFGSLLNSEVEAIMPESVLPESVSRIHHSPESTH